MSYEILYIISFPIKSGYFFPSGNRDLSDRCVGCNRINEPSERGSFEYDGRQPEDFATGIGRKLCKASVAEAWERDFEEVRTYPVVLTRGGGRWFDKDPYREVGLDTLVKPDLSLPRFDGLDQCAVCGVVNLPGKSDRVLRPDFFDGDEGNAANIVARFSQLENRNFAWFQWRNLVCTHVGKQYLEGKGWGGFDIQPLGFLVE